MPTGRALLTECMTHTRNLWQSMAIYGNLFSFLSEQALHPQRATQSSFRAAANLLLSLLMPIPEYREI